ncbi:MAG: hypothetical protein GF320_06290 [Armatimonadia bacterium]|nr:hypothetical protein [Armatimonadia bacterium]
MPSADEGLPEEEVEREPRQSIHGAEASNAPKVVVALGASAGGLDAYGEFLKALPDAPGMAFVLVQHLAPDHKSHMAELLAEEVVPTLVARASADRPIRAWVPGCATGEEAYSLAILLTKALQGGDQIRVASHMSTPRGSRGAASGSPSWPGWPSPTGEWSMSRPSGDRVPRRQCSFR